MIFIGYLSIFAYIFFMIFVVGTLLQKRFSTEISRKIVHISLFMVWVFIDLFLKNTVHQIVIPLCFLALNLISYKFKIFKSIERADDKNENHFGTIYFAVAIFFIMIAAYMHPVLFPYTGIAVFALTFGDGFAALVGHLIKSKKIYYSKSILGFASCFVATFASVTAFKFIYSVQISILNIAVLALITAILELVYFGLDNFSITIPITALAYFMTVSSDSQLYISIYIAVAIFMIVFFSGAIDYLGSLASSVIVFCFGYFGGYYALAFLLACYFAIFIISAVAKRIKKDKKHRPRDIFQILINGGLGTLFIVLSWIYSSSMFAVVGLIAVSGCFVDSVSSDVGTLSKKRPYDFIHKKHIETGLSGGVSTLGTVSAVVASLICALGIYLITPITIIDMVIATIIIFLQTIFDTVFGATLQAKYVCSRCSKTVEKPRHCGTGALHVSGTHFFDNNIVNLVTSFFTCVLASVYFVLPVSV